MSQLDDHWHFRNATDAWNVEEESLDHINLRIHDGVAIENLDSRGDSFVRHVCSLFPYIDFNKPHVLEIGSGVGYIMAAVERATRDSAADRSIIGLDVSLSMIGRAQERLASLPDAPKDVFSFLHYNGLHIPLSDNSVDIIYSFATLQHIPKPYVYNLFYEIKRILKPSGLAVLHFLPFSYLSEQERVLPWRNEVLQQVGLGPNGHWHHYYSTEELSQVFAVTGFAHIDLSPGIFACIGKQPIATNDYPVKQPSFSDKATVKTGIFSLVKSLFASRS